MTQSALHGFKCLIFNMSQFNISIYTEVSHMFWSLVTEVVCRKLLIIDSDLLTKTNVGMDEKEFYVKSNEIKLQ